MKSSLAPVALCLLPAVAACDASVPGDTLDTAPVHGSFHPSDGPDEGDPCRVNGDSYPLGEVHLRTVEEVYVLLDEGDGGIDDSLVRRSTVISRLRGWRRDRMTVEQAEHVVDHHMDVVDLSGEIDRLEDAFRSTTRDAVAQLHETGGVCEGGEEVVDEAREKLDDIERAVRDLHPRSTWEAELGDVSCDTVPVPPRIYRDLVFNSYDELTPKKRKKLERKMVRAEAKLKVLMEEWNRLVAERNGGYLKDRKFDDDLFAGRRILRERGRIILSALPKHVVSSLEDKWRAESGEGEVGQPLTSQERAMLESSHWLIDNALDVDQDWQSKDDTELEYQRHWPVVGSWFGKAYLDGARHSYYGRLLKCVSDDPDVGGEEWDFAGPEDPRLNEGTFVNVDL